MRIFLDTNVLVSAYTARLGFCAELLELILTDPQCSLLKGEVNLSELRSVLRRRPFRLRPALVEEIERELRDQTIVPRPLHPANLPVRDPADRWVLASAVAGRADLLVTGDKDLLDIADESSLPIVTPRECRTKLLTARARERE
ncbi:MAG TPA: putative toxin-antitoxin system toxin component, PIN family [Candidatus Binatia bacterium]